MLPARELDAAVHFFEEAVLSHTTMTGDIRPFFSTPPDQSPRRGRLLLISYHFPPNGSAGALRWQRLASHAARYGWSLDVITVTPSTVSSSDTARLHELPAGTRVFGAGAGLLTIDRIERKIWSAYQSVRGALKRKAETGSAAARVDDRPQPNGRPQSLGRADILALRWNFRVAVRSYYAYLYHRRSRKWAMNALSVAYRLTEEVKYAAVISCGPPHEAHPAGAAVARRAKVPHIVDMRDPWSLAERVPELIATPLIYWIAESAEKRIARSAALIVCNTEASRVAFAGEFPPAAGRSITVMNGYDLEPLPAAREDGRFLIAYAGSVYLDRSPTALFRAASRVIAARGLSPSDFAIEFMGSQEASSGPTIEDHAEAAGISTYFQMRSQGSRAEALEFLAGAAMLVSLLQDSRMAIPSKVFEYMQYDAWLLALADAGSATQQVLAGSGADVVGHDDVDALTEVLLRRYDQYRQQGRPHRPAMIPSCSRAEQARVLFDAIDRVTLEAGG